MATLVSDSFNRADTTTLLGTADVGGAWSNDTNWLVSSNKASPGSFTTTTTRTAFLLAGTNSVDITASVVTGTNKTNMGVLFYSNGSGNYWHVALTRNATGSTNKVDLIQAQAGVSTTLDTASASINLASTHTLRVIANTTSVVVQLDGVELINYAMTGADQALIATRTYVGLRTIMGSNSTHDDGNCRWDSFVASDPSSAPSVFATRTDGWETSDLDTAGTSLTHTLGFTPVAGRSLVAVVHSEAVPSISGWNFAAFQEGVSGIYMLTKTATGSETNVPVTFAGSTRAVLAVSQWSNADITAMLSRADARTSESTATLGTATDLPAEGGDAAIAVVGWRSSTTQTVSTSGYAANLTEQLDTATSNVSGARLAMALAEDSIDTTGDYATTVTPSSSSSGVFMYVLLPAASGLAVPTPAKVSAVASVSTPTVSVPVATTPAVTKVSAVAAVSTPTVLTAGITLVPATSVAARAVVNEFVAVDVDTAVLPDSVAAVAAQPIPAVLGDSQAVTAVPATKVSAVAAVGTPVVNTGTSVSLLPVTVTAVATVDDPNVEVDITSSVTATVVPATATIPRPNPVSTSVSFALPAVEAVASVGTAVISTGSTIYLFVTPYVEEGPVDWRNPLLARMTIRRGITVLKESGVYRQVRYPSQEESEAADICYIGGTEHYIEGDEITDLTAAGYGDYLTPLE